MKMMNKLSMLALAMCAASTMVHAEEKSYGTATAKTTVNATQEWKIETVSDGVINLNKDGKFDSYGTFATFKVINNTATASNYYLTGRGTAQTIVASRPGLSSVDEIGLVPYGVNGDKFIYDGHGKYPSPSQVAAGASYEFQLKLTDHEKSRTLTPESYNVLVELFAPSV